MVSISHLVGITVQKWIVLRFPYRARIWATQLSNALYIVVPSWLYGMFWATLPLLGWSSYRPFNRGSKLCGPDLANYHIDLSNNSSNSSYSDVGLNAASYLISLLIFCYAIPIFIITISCYSIWRLLKDMRTNGQGLGLGNKLLLARRKSEVKQCWVGGMIVGSFLLAWSPFACCVLCQALGKPVPPNFLLVSAMLGKSSSIFNPIYYMFLSGGLRTNLRKILSAFRTPRTISGTAPQRRPITNMNRDYRKSKENVDNNLLGYKAEHQSQSGRRSDKS